MILTGWKLTSSWGVKMFILLSGIQSSIKLIDAILKKLDKLSKIKHEKGDNRTSETSLFQTNNKNDEFKPDTDECCILKEINDLVLLLLKCLINELGADNELNGYLKLLHKDLKECVNGDLVLKLNDKSFRQNLTSCLEEILKFCLEKQKGATQDDDKALWEKATNAFSIVSALPPLTAISKLLKIAQDPKFPKEVRVLATCMVNDALSHMKQRNVDNSSAKILLGLLISTPSNVRELLYSALTDAKTMEKVSRAFPQNRYKTPMQEGLFSRSLTIA